MIATRRRLQVLAPAVLVLVVAAACGSPPPSEPSAQETTASPGTSGATSTATTAVASPSPVASAPAASPTEAATVSPTAPPTPTPAPTRAPTAAPPVEAFPQTWAGTWTDPVTGGAGSLELVLTGAGDDFGGSITMDGTACLAAGILTGRYDDAEIVFTVSQRDVDLAFVGEVSDAGMRGTFTSTCEGMDGTWEVQRASR